MFEKIASEKTRLTQRKSERLLALNTFPGQRSVKPKHVSFLANVIRAGLFTSGNIGIAVFKNGNGEKQKYLVNGQHQCNATILANEGIDVIIEEYFCDTIADVSLLYRQYDNNAIRSPGDLIRMEMYSLGKEWPLRIARLVVGAVVIKTKSEQAHKNEKIELLKTVLPFGDFMSELLSNEVDGNYRKVCSHLLRKPIAYSMLVTFEKSRVDSNMFWRQVRDGEGLKRTMPSFKLREFLKESNYNHGRGAQSLTKRVVSQHEMIYRSISAWNAFRAGKNAALRYYPTKQVPKAK